MTSAGRLSAAEPRGLFIRAGCRAILRSLCRNDPAPGAGGSRWPRADCDRTARFQDAGPAPEGCCDAARILRRYTGRPGPLGRPGNRADDRANRRVSASDAAHPGHRGSGDGRRGGLAAAGDPGPAGRSAADLVADHLPAGPCPALRPGRAGGDGFEPQPAAHRRRHQGACERCAGGWAAHRGDPGGRPGGGPTAGRLERRLQGGSRPLRDDDRRCGVAAGRGWHGDGRREPGWPADPGGVGPRRQAGWRLVRLAAEQPPRSSRLEPSTRM